jgi:DNA-directed RNA polymerase subunit beta
MEVRRLFGRVSEVVVVPDLIEIQTKSYEDFLQTDVPGEKRENKGLEALLREIFPIESYDGKYSLEYLKYELGKPLYSIDQCRQLRLTYGRPFRIWVRLNKEQPIEEEVYLGELPIMIGGGEFVINGAERVIVSQLHRSPGVDFMVDTESGDRRLHAARIIPERGSWVEMNVTKRDVLVVRIDQSGKFPVTMFLRAMSAEHSDDASIIRAFYKTATVKISGSRSFQPLQGKYLVSDVVNEATGEVILEAGSEINELTFASILDALLNTGGQAKRAEDKAGGSQLSDLKDVFRFVPESDLLSYENRSKFPKEGGVYGWYLDELPPGVPKEGCRTVGKWTLLDVGKADKGSLNAILRQHFTLNAKGSALRKSLGVLLGYERTYKSPKEAEKKFVFKNEKQLSEWLEEHARVVCIDKRKIEESGSTVEDFEKDLIAEYCLPLNDQKNDHPFAAVLGRKKERAGEDVNVSEEWEKVKRAPEWHDYKELHEKKEAAAEKRRLGRKADEEKHHRDREAERLNLKKGQECEVEVIDEKQADPLILNTVRDDPADSQESALLRIYARLRPGNPPQIEKAKDLFKEKFFDANRYRLGGVGRFRMNRKFGTKVGEDEQTLKADDIINCVRYLLGLRKGEGRIDDIDHLGNRRVRTISELAADEIRKGFLKLRRTIQERMSLGDQTEMTPRTLVNSKTISSSIDYFFGRGELSQVVDQTNPLSQLAHERRLSALGPGGLNRKRAGFEVRDVHISHYGRICPIETPEGSNIGLISNLSIFSRVDEYGFLITPYRVVKNGKITSETVFLRADQEEDHYIAPADQDFANETILARLNGDFLPTDRKKVQYVDLSPRQLVGVSAGLIPFLEHDDANRALMGSNMQRQAVPLVRCEPPIVATGLEGDVPQYSGMVVTADADGTVTKVTADEIVIGDRTYRLRKFVGLNERTCLNQKPIVKMGEKVKKKQVIADGAATKDGLLALGRNVLVGFMPWDGYNFEDAILVNERLVEEDAYTSIHVEEFEVEIRETKLGREEFTRDIPNVSERELANLDEHGIIRVGTLVKPGDILVGKIAPKSKSELTPEEKLLQAIFGRAGEDVKNDSLEVPAGIEGIVIHTERFQRKVHLSDIERLETENLVRIKTEEYDEKKAERLREALEAIEELVGGKIPLAGKKRSLSKVKATGQKKMIELVQKLKFEELEIEGGKTGKAADALWKRYIRERDELADECEREVGRIRRGDKLPSGVLELVKAYVATKRVLSVGDKMAGRHGNKGVIAKILSTEDMPFLADGTPLDIVLNPLGVPSRMNVGQILETHLGWAAKVLGFTAVCPVFDGATEEETRAALKEAGLPEDGKVVLYDGRTGDSFTQKVTVGYIYMMKLHHLVDDKVHARATGPYSLITQQPLGGKARSGGQRFGEMEVWALEAYGAAHVLQEILTVKSDDVEGRTKIYESMIKGENTLEAGTPVSFEVLTNEIKGLCLNMELLKRRVAI